MFHHHYRGLPMGEIQQDTLTALGGWLQTVVDLRIYDIGGWGRVLGAMPDSIKRWIKGDVLLESRHLSSILHLLEHREGYRAQSVEVRREFEEHIGPMQLDPYRTVDDHRTDHDMRNFLMAMATLTNRQRRAVARAAHAACNRLCLGDERGAIIKDPWDVMREELMAGPDNPETL